MDGIRQYLLSVIASAMICGMITGLLGKKGTYPSVVKMLCGLFVSITIISPIKQIQFSDYKANLHHLSKDANEIVEQSKINTQNAVAKLIEEKVEAYILKRADELDLQISVDVILDTADSYTPKTIIIYGAASASAKQSLQEMIIKELGIAKENQVWK